MAESSTKLSFTVLEARKLKSFIAGPRLTRLVSSGDSCLAFSSFQKPLTSLGSRLTFLLFKSLSLCPSTSADSLCLSYKEPVVTSGPLGSPGKSSHIKILNLVTSVKSLLPDEIIFMGFRD